MKNRRLLAVALLGLAAPATAQTVIYETGFENPPFNAGLSLQGGDAWLIQATPANPAWAIAQSSQFTAGTQGAELQNVLATGSSWAWKDVMFNPVTAGTPVVTVSWDMNISATGTVTQAGVDVYSATPFARIIALGVNATGQVNHLVGAATVFTNTTATVTPGQWNSFRIVFNYTTNQLDLFMNNVEIASNLAFPAGVDFGDADLWKGGAGTASVYYDNFKITAGTGACYPDCNNSGTLTLADFGCFQGKYVLGDLYADCNNSGTLSLADFGCFQSAYVLGCP